MFVSTRRSGYTSQGEQQASGDFLILASHPTQKTEFGHEKLFCCVRFVSMKQFGHFMMGSAKIQSLLVTLSGPFGNDGLPMNYLDLFAEQRKHFIEIPAEEAENYWNCDDSPDEVWITRQARRARDHRFGDHQLDKPTRGHDISVRAVGFNYYPLA